MTDKGIHMRSLPRGVFLGLMLLAFSASAADKVLVLTFNGKKAIAAEKAVVQAFSGERDLKVLTQAKLKPAQQKLAKKIAAKPDAKSLHRLADELELLAIVHGKVVGGKRVFITIYADDGSEIGRSGWVAKSPSALGKMPAVAKKRLLRSLEAPPDEGGTEAPERPTPVAKSTPAPSDFFEDAPIKKPEPAREERPTRVARREEVDDEPVVAEVAPEDKSTSWLEASVGTGVLSRSFAYSDSLAAGDRSFNYGLPSAPLLLLGADFYPRPLLGKIGSIIGLKAEFQTVFGLRTRTESGASHGTSAFGWAIGPQARYAIGPVLARASLLAGQESFLLGIQQSPEEDGPDAAYTFFEPSVGAEWSPLRSITVFGRAGYRFLTGAGELVSSVYLPQAKSGAWEAQLGAGYGITENLEVRVSGRLRRYDLTAVPVESSPITDGRSSDVYRQGTVSVIYKLF